MDVVGLVVYALLTIVALTTVGVAIAAYRVFSSLPRATRPKVRSSQPASPSAQISRELEGRMLNLVNGDRATAYRLVSLTKASNPGRPESWCWEKAIEDLIRDRR